MIDTIIKKLGKNEIKLSLSNLRIYTARPVYSGDDL